MPRMWKAVPASSRDVLGVPHLGPRVCEFWGVLQTQNQQIRTLSPLIDPYMNAIHNKPEVVFLLTRPHVRPVSRT